MKFENFFHFFTEISSEILKRLDINKFEIKKKKGNCNIDENNMYGN